MPTGDSPEDRLARQAQANPTDPRVWEELYVLLKKRLEAVACSVTSNHHDAEDAVHDALLDAVRRIHTWDPERSFRPWIVQIVRRRALDILRRRRRRQENSVVEDDNLLYLPSADAPATTAVDREFLRSVLADLDDVHRQAIVLRYVVELSFNEIGEVLEVPPTTVRDWVHAIEFQWQQRFKKAFEGDEE
jgi:RNA polymerase sigma factor (sigma-70 family)